MNRFINASLIITCLFGAAMSASSADVGISGEKPTHYRSALDAKGMAAAVDQIGAHPSPTDIEKFSQFSHQVDWQQIPQMEAAGTAETANSIQQATPRRLAPNPLLAKPMLNTWLTYFSASHASGLAALASDAGRFNEVSLFATQFQAQSAGGYSLIPAVSSVVNDIPTVRQADPHARVLMTVTNDVRPAGETSSADDIAKDPNAVNYVTSPANRAQHIQDLLNVVTKDNVDGLDIDYEQIPASAGVNFGLFIQDLATALHAKGKYLSVDVEYDNNNVNWNVVGAAADRVRILAYNYAYGGSAPGPVIPPPTVLASIMNKAKAAMPAKKIEIALATHGYDWTIGVPGANNPQIDTNAAIALAAQYHATITRDPATGAAKFNYVVNGVTHQVWFEDAESIRINSLLIHADGIANIGLWELGSGDLSSFLKTLPHPPSRS